jgi:spoIIIJ-associated protein
MKDQIFTGRNVAEAVDIAGRTLGLAPDAIRYVVLEREAPGVMGIGGTPARIAVLLDARKGGSGAGPMLGANERPRGEGGERERSSAPRERPQDLRAALRAFVRELAETGEIDLTAEVEEDEQRTTVRLFGADRELLLERGAEALLALDHIIQRAFAHDIHPRRLVVECEGYRETRDAALETKARELADAVRADGQPRETEPLNSYERRIIHVTLTDAPGVRTFSVGEGPDRRVTIAPAEVPPSEGGDSR